MKTRSVFEPTEKNPKGEIHEDFGVFSYDRTRKTFVMREFLLRLEVSDQVGELDTVVYAGF